MGVHKPAFQKFGSIRRRMHFSEKGGKSREIPVRHDTAQTLLGYIKATGVATNFPQ